MDRIPLSQIAEMAGAKILQGSPEVLVSSLSKDSRTIQLGDLYIALRGENFDGNAYAADALAGGAAGVLMDSAEAAHSIPSPHPVLLVENGLAALTRMAVAWRSKLKLKVVGITGSSGKTSTKDFTAAVIGSRLKVVKTAGNLNNHIGVPLSILSANSEDDVAVWEVGMNHPGEIAPLAELIKPDCVIITNIGVAHIEHGFHEGLEVDRFGSGMGSWHLGVANHIFHCSDQTASHVGCIQQMLDKKSGGRFAIRSCDAHRFEAERRLAMEFGSDIGHGFSGIRYNHQRAIALRDGFFGNDGSGAAFSGLYRECCSVAIFSREGKEKTSLFGFTRVIAKRSDFGVGQPLWDS